MIRLDPANRHYEPQRYRPRPGADPGPPGRPDPPLLAMADAAHRLCRIAERHRARADARFLCEGVRLGVHRLRARLFGDHQRRRRPRAQRPAGDALAAPLPVIRVDDLEAALDAVTKAGGSSPSRSSPSPAGGGSTSSTPRAASSPCGASELEPISAVVGSIVALHLGNAVGREAAALRRAGGSAPRSARDRRSRSCRR